MKENSEIGYISGTKSPKPVENKGILLCLSFITNVKGLSPNNDFSSFRFVQVELSIHIYMDEVLIPNLRATDTLGRI